MKVLCYAYCVCSLVYNAVLSLGHFSVRGSGWTIYENFRKWVLYPLSIEAYSVWKRCRLLSIERSKTIKMLELRGNKYKEVSGFSTISNLISSKHRINNYGFWCRERSGGGGGGGENVFWGSYYYKNTACPMLYTDIKCLCWSWQFKFFTFKLNCFYERSSSILVSLLRFTA